LINYKSLLIFFVNILLISNIAFAQTNGFDCSTLSPRLSIALNDLRNLFPYFIPSISQEEAIIMKWQENGRLSDIAPDIITYRNFNGSQSEEIIGLKINVEINLSNGRRLFIMDDEHKVLPFWWKMLKEGIISYNEKFLHIDAHLDTLIQEKANKPISNKQSVKNVFDLSFTAKESGFLIPAFASKIIDAHNSYLMDTRYSKKANQLFVTWKSSETIKKVIMSETSIIPEDMDFGLICVDLDALAGLTPKEAYLELKRFAGLCKNAKAITIATSPQYMLNQKLAVHYTIYLTNLLLNETKLDDLTDKETPFPNTRQKIKPILPGIINNKNIDHSI